MLTIAQITDLHITNGSQPKDQARNAARLRTALKSVLDLKRAPSAILLTGDLVDLGQPDEYAALKDILSDSENPALFRDRQSRFPRRLPPGLSAGAGG